MRRTNKCWRCGNEVSSASELSPTGVCPKCMKEVEANARYDKWENMQKEKFQLTCPWCGYEERDSWERDDEEEDYECKSCGKLFSYEREVEVRYTSWKRECDYPEKMEG